MKLVVSSLIAIVVLYFADKEMANGKFADALLSLFRTIAQSFGF